MRGQYGFDDHWRGEASGTYYFPGKNQTLWDATVNMHYLVPVSSQFTIYPLAGLSYVYYGYDGAAIVNQINDALNSLAGVLGSRVDGIVSSSDTSFSRLGVNLGGGATIRFSSAVAINAEVYYRMAKDFNAPVVSLGLALGI